MGGDASRPPPARAAPRGGCRAPPSIRGSGSARHAWGSSRRLGWVIVLHSASGCVAPGSFSQHSIGGRRPEPRWASGLPGRLSHNRVPSTRANAMQIDEELTLKKLEVFLAFMRSGSLSKAAAELNTSNVSVHRAIHSLESALRCPLFK